MGTGCCLLEGVKRPGHEADHTLPSGASVKWSYTSTPPMCFHGIHRGVSLFWSNDRGIEMIPRAVNCER